MDLAPTREQEAFRAECRAWLEPTCPGSTASGCRRCSTTCRGGRRSSASGRASWPPPGWVGVTWPEEYGGRGAGPLHHYIVQEELARARAPELVGRIGVNLVGPDAAGPRHRRAEGPLAARASSRPSSSAASCSASPTPAATWPSLRPGPSGSTAAGRLHGQKVWTSYAQFADWGLCLARTDPGRAQAQGHLGVRGRHARARGRGPPPRARSPARPSSTRSSSTARSSPTTSSSARRTTAGGCRARRSPTSGARTPASSSSTPSCSRSCSGWPTSGGTADDRRIEQRLAQAYVEVRLFQLHNWRSLSRLAARARARPRSGDGQAVLERDEQAPARTPPWRCSATPRRCGGARTATPATDAGSGPGSTTRRVDLRRHQRDPAHHHRGAGPGAAPRAAS